MKKITNLFLVVALVAVCLSGAFMGGTFNTALASSVDIGDLMKEDATVTTAPAADTSKTTEGSQDGSMVTEKQNNLIDTISNNMDYTVPESPEVKKFGELVQRVTSYIVQGLTYVFTALLVIHKLIDLFYVGIPFTRTVLANGYMGNAAAAGTQAQSMNPGMGGMGMGMGGMGGGFGRPGFGGGYGMRGGMGMGMGGSVMGGADAQMASQNQPARGRIQFVSNAALNAVATESVIGPDGKGQSAFKTYVKDMMISLIVAPVLLVLCVTGAIAKVGFGIGSIVANILTNIKF